ncbi:hypothetical protein H4219_001988 [Mycoemilia scoparia]|uniref:Uncharacterized protein n=1 Tax=Mycoemilia scoparia TaxID=417184 RepID=A0A9W8A290_9FUNG|nr:hypothetical protein H4219_001988 [Mycoemilia scoparia]
MGRRKQDKKPLKSPIKKHSGSVNKAKKLKSPRKNKMVKDKLVNSIDSKTSDQSVAMAIRGIHLQPNTDMEGLTMTKEERREAAQNVWQKEKQDYNETLDQLTALMQK